MHDIGSRSKTNGACMHVAPVHGRLAFLAPHVLILGARKTHVLRCPLVRDTWTPSEVPALVLFHLRLRLHEGISQPRRSAPLRRPPPDHRRAAHPAVAAPFPSVRLHQTTEASLPSAARGFRSPLHSLAAAAPTQGTLLLPLPY